MPAIAAAQSAPMSYKTASGQYAAALMATPVSSSGGATVSGYKGADGLLHAPTVVSIICGVDSNGFPQVCPSTNGGMTQSQADARYLQLSGGTITGTITGSNSANVILPLGTLHAGYVTADAVVSGAAFQTGWNGAYTVTSKDGDASTSVGADTNGNLTLASREGRGGGVVLGNFTYANLPQNEPSDGVIVGCSDCVYNGVTGVQLHWNKTAGSWYTIDNVKVTSSNIATNFNSMIDATDGYFSGVLTAGTGLQIKVPNSSVTGGILPIGDLGLQLTNSNGAVMDLRAGSIYSLWLMVPKAFSYANLPPSAPEGGEATCTDCWSSSNSNGQSAPGIHVFWLNNQWSDALGAAVKHP